MLNFGGVRKNDLNWKMLEIPGEAPPQAMSQAKTEGKFVNGFWLVGGVWWMEKHGAIN